MTSEPSNRTPAYLAGGVLLVVVLIAAVAYLMAGGDTGTIAVESSSPGIGAETSAPDGTTEGVTVDGDDLPTSDDTDGGADPAVGLLVPTITGPDGAGGTVTIEPGTPTVVVVMAHWCPHCQAEIPRIVEWAEDGAVPDDVDVIGVSTAVDETRGNYPPTSWLEAEDWPFPTLQDDEDNTALNALGVSGFPTLIAIGADGRVALRVSGEGDEDRFDQLIDAALQGAPADPADDGATGGTPAYRGDEGTAPCPAADGSAAQQQSFDGVPPVCIDPTLTYTANVTTSMGAFTIELDAAKAQLTVNSFVFLARYHYFDGITFHRIIPDFVIQGGDPEGTGMGGPGYEFEDELPRSGEYERYSLAMANAGPDTNGSQFFIITGEQGEELPPSYSLFGKVVSGTDVVDAIGVVPTGDDDQPVTPVVIQSVQIVEGS